VELAGKANFADHFVVHAGTDTKATVVHRQDSGTNTGRDEQALLATFAEAGAAFVVAGATERNLAEVTNYGRPGDGETGLERDAAVTLASQGDVSVPFEMHDHAPNRHIKSSA